MAIEYLSLTGLSKYDAKIKDFINSKVSEGDAKSFKYVNLEDGVLKFYTVNPITDGTVAAYEIELPEQDLSNLMQLVKTATENNVAIFDANGQVKDSGLAFADIATKSDVTSAKDELQASIDELEAYVGTIPSESKATNIVSYVNEKAQEVLESATGGSSESAASVKLALDQYKAENDPKVAANTTAAENAQATADSAKDAADKVAGDLTTEVSAREDADEALDSRITELESKIVGISGALHFKGVVDSLPEDVSGYADGDVIIVGNKEYLFNNGEFVEFGDVDAISEAVTALTGRVDTVETDLDTLEQTHSTDVETLTAKDAEIEQSVKDLKESIVEITEAQINALFQLDEE